jgi:hypothetical protein
MAGCSGDSWDSLASVVEFGIYYGIWRDVFFKCFFGLHVSDKDVYGDSIWCLSRLKKATATTSLIPQICMARLATTPLQPFRSISTDLLKLGRLLKTLEIITGDYENEREETYQVRGPAHECRPQNRSEAAPFAEWPSDFLGNRKGLC